MFAELLDQIFESLDGHKNSLASSSLVCRSWRASSQAQLFQRLLVAHNKSLSSFFSFVETGQFKLRILVKHVIIGEPDHRARTNVIIDLADSSLLTLLHNLPSLHSLELFQVHYDTPLLRAPDTEMSWMARRLTRLQPLRPFKRLTLHRVTGASSNLSPTELSDIMSLFTEIDSLDYHGDPVPYGRRWTGRGGSLSRTPLPAYVPGEWLRIKRIKLAFVTPDVFHLLDTYATSGCVDQAFVSCGDWNTLRPLQTLLAHNLQTLRSLHLFFLHWDPFGSRAYLSYSPSTSVDEWSRLVLQSMTYLCRSFLMGSIYKYACRVDHRAAERLFRPRPVEFSSLILSERSPGHYRKPPPPYHFLRGGKTASGTRSLNSGAAVVAS